MISRPSPLVSVLMTAYNREKYIAEAIESVLASIYTNFELIIVDDCSTDDTVKIANEYGSKDERIRVYVNERNIGDYNNRNKAASYAVGKYIVYLDSDDLMYDFSLLHSVRYMEMFPEAGFGVYSKSDIKKPYPVCINPRQIYEEHYFGEFGHFSRSPGSAIIKLDVFKSLNGFSGKRFVGDMEFWMKIARFHKMVKHCVPTFWYRNENSDKESKYEKNT